MVNVGFILSDDVINWNGGINYYRNLFLILKESGDYIPVVFVSSKRQKQYEEKFEGIKIVPCNVLSNRSLLSLLRKVIYYSFGRNLFINKYLIKENVQIVSHNELPLDRKSSIPSCGWIPDFQYIHYPNFFPRKNIRRNRFNHSYLANNSTRIVVSSKDSEKDLLSLLPELNSKKITVLNFAIPNNNISTSKQSDEVLTKYKLKQYAYYVISNQFWKHKNHLIVLKALHELLATSEKLNFKVVATGLFYDPRDKQSSIDILDYINMYSLSEYFVVTGSIPYNEVTALQMNSIAIIQPSLFEGWNTTVEECKRLGKKIILSNISVHIEQNPENVVFFNPNNEKQLAKILDETFREYDVSKERDFAINAIVSQQKRWEKFSNDYISLIEQTIRDKNAVTRKQQE